MITPTPDDLIIQGYDSDGATFYVIALRDAADGRSKMLACRRFSEFRKLHLSLSALLGKSAPTFQAKRRILNDSSARPPRREMLQDYIRQAATVAVTGGEASNILATFLRGYLAPLTPEKGPTPVTESIEVDGGIGLSNKKVTPICKTRTEGAPVHVLEPAVERWQGGLQSEQLEGEVQPLHRDRTAHRAAMVRHLHQKNVD
jgi:hypothetical protein